VGTQDIFIPDMGTSEAVDVIEVLVKAGDLIEVDTPLITLESDKASMDVPSPMAGRVKKLHLKVGDKVKEGGLILTLEVEGAAAASKPSSPEPVVEKKKETTPPSVATPATPPVASKDSLHAGPAVRRLARELGIDLTMIVPTGAKSRIQLDDVHGYIKNRMNSGGGSASPEGLSIPKAPVIDFSQFGSIQTEPLSKIKKISGANLQRSWITIPHVTQFDEADITELEDFRLNHKSMAEKKGYKLTPLVFIIKAVVATLKTFPRVNASLDASGENLILKQYYHIGVAVDTPNGLVVPVIRDADTKSLMDLAKELGEVSEKAREKGLSIKDMQGASFTISSLGGISGTGFTPIVNSPEVGILGVSKSMMKPFYQEGTFVPRLMLPLSFSYDHRVIDGAEAARFTKHLCSLLSDIRRVLL